MRRRLPLGPARPGCMPPLGGTAGADSRRHRPSHIPRLPPLCSRPRLHQRRALPLQPRPLHRRPPQRGLLRIAGVPLGSSDTFLSIERPTFEDYLTNTVGSKQTPQVEFSLLAVSLDSAFDMIASGELDFVYANPSLHSCLEAEFGGHYLQPFFLFL
jgi:hypothetical protein